jgi:hypothetical protein
MRKDNNIKENLTIKEKKRVVLRNIKQNPNLYNDLNVINRGLVQFYLKNPNHKTIQMVAEILYGYYKGVKEDEKSK